MVETDVRATEESAPKRARLETPASSSGEVNPTVPAEDVPAEAAPRGLVEADVGITEFVSALAGFKGTLKQRYTDFQVNEIDEAGAVVRLTEVGAGSQEEPKKVEPETKPEAKAEGEAKPEPREIPDIEPFRAELEALVGAETVAKSLELFRTGLKFETPESYTEKDQRTKIHQLFKRAFAGRLETSTNDDQRLAVRLATQETRGVLPRSRHGKMLKFLRFTVYKENKETLEVAGLVAKLLRISPRAIAFAGTKDRRGVTTQRFSVQHMSIPRVASLNRALRGIKLGNMAYHPEPLRLGDLTGNQFAIAVRDLEAATAGADGRPAAGVDVAAIDAALAALRDRGFINYFGLQRFGTFSVSTHAVGKHILVGDYDAAVAAILQPQALAADGAREAREVWRTTGDAARALALMPARCVAEHSLLSTLAETPSAINALLRVPRNLRIMYVHAYQSYVWNRVASARFARGFEVEQGDLVEAGWENGFQRARPVTAEEAAAKAFTIYDVLLPTPGFDVVYPANLEGEYAAVMGADGIDHRQMRRNIKEFSLSGGYRSLMARPGALEWRIVEYSEADEQLLYTDLDVHARGGDAANWGDRVVERPTQAEPAEDAGAANTSAAATAAAAPRHALLLSMTLGTSQYATMALREAMKVDTGRHGGMYFS